MAAPKDNIKICQGSLYQVEFELVDDNGFGIDVTSAQIRKDIRHPDRSGTLAISLSETVDDAISGFYIVPPEVIPAMPVAEFADDDTIIVTGEPFQQQVKRVVEDSNGNQTGLEIVTENVVNVGDLVLISGSTLNDAADWRVASVVDANTITVCKISQSIVPEAPGTGTINIIRYGRFVESIIPADSEAFDFESGEYDIEILVDIAKPETKERFVQGGVKIDKEATES